MNIKTKENIVEFLLKSSAAITILTTLGIIWVLLSESFTFFEEVSIVDFLTDDQWTPLFANKHFGIMPLISGTLLTTVIAVSVSSVAAEKEEVKEFVRFYLESASSLVSEVGYIPLLDAEYTKEIEKFNAFIKK